MADTGAIGSVLTDVALGYLEGLLKPSKADLDAERALKLEKAQEDIGLSRTQQRLNEAQAEYQLRRQPVRARLYKVGTNLVQDNEEGKPEVVYEGPVKEPNELERLRGAARAHMERIVGRKYGLPTVPMNAWKDEDWDDPALDKLRDFAGVGRSPLATYPGGGGDVGPKRDVPGYGGRPGGEKPPPATSGGAPPGPSETPPSGKQFPAEKAVPPKKGIAEPPPVKKVPEGIDAEADPVLVNHYAEVRWKNLPQAEAQKQFDVLYNDKMTQPVNRVSALQGFYQRYGVWPKGLSVKTEEGPRPGKPAAPGKPEGAAPPPQTTEAPPTTRQRNMPLTKEQQEEEDRKRQDQQLQADAARRSQQLLDVTLRNEKRDEAKIVQQLKEYEESKKAKNLAAQERIEKNILLETRDYRAQLTGADETIALLQEMGRYVNPSTVGATGAVRQMWQNLKGQFERSHREPLKGEAGQIQRKVMPMAGQLMQDAAVWQADENARAAQEGRQPTKIYMPDFSKYDPSMTFIGFLKEVIGYAQARAMNGVGRLTDQDLDRAKFALGIDDWTKSAAHVQTSLLYVQRELRNKKIRVQATIDAIEKQLRRHAPKAGESGAETGETVKE